MASQGVHLPIQRATTVDHDTEASCPHKNSNVCAKPENDQSCSLWTLIER
jgi:hypothetical protein